MGNRQVAIVVQTTYNIERFRGATSHGRSKKFLFTVGAERKNSSKILPSTCLDLLKALGERVRTRGNSIAGREADSGCQPLTGPRLHTEPTPSRQVEIAFLQQYTEGHGPHL